MDAVVFDWDGTLVDSLPAITRANAEVMRSYGIAFDADVYRQAYSPDWQSMYARLGIPSAEVHEAGLRWLDAYRRDVVEPTAMPGAEAALERLAAAGLRLGLVTAGEREVVENQLEKTGLGRFLAVRVCGGDMPESKPHPAPLRKALRELGIDAAPERTIYVGDALDDMRMARTAGARGIGILSMMGTREELLQAGASEVADSVAAWVTAFLGPP